MLETMVDKLAGWIVRFLRLSSQGKVAVTVIVVAAIGGTAFGAHAVVTPQRSTANFCKVYSQEKAKYIRDTSSDNVGVGLMAVMAVPQLFDKLDKVAPDEIESDVANIRDSLKKSMDAGASGTPDNPFAGLGGALVAGLQSAQSWQNVSNFVDQRCPKTPEEQAALKAQADKAALEKAGIDVYNGVVAINGDVVNDLGMENTKPLGLTDQLDGDLQSMRDEIANQRRQVAEAIPGTLVPSDCDNLRSTLKYSYDMLAADIKSVKANGWPPTIEVSPTSLNPITLRQDISELQTAINRYRQLGGDPSAKTPNSESPDATVTKAQAYVAEMDAEIENAKTHTPDWYLNQLHDIYLRAHLGGICG
jgi:hypothetical protein